MPPVLDGNSLIGTGGLERHFSRYPEKDHRIDAMGQQVASKLVGSSVQPVFANL
jgi:hypothetical protein